MRSDRPKPLETGQVILFRPRQAGSSRPAAMPPKRTSALPATPPTGLRRSQRSRDDDEDPRHRRLIHALGLAFCLVLATAGVWLANEFAEMKRVQDCVLSGRSLCIPLDLAAHSG